MKEMNTNEWGQSIQSFVIMRRKKVFCIICAMQNFEGAYQFSKVISQCRMIESETHFNATNQIKWQQSAPGHGHMPQT